MRNLRVLLYGMAYLLSGCMLMTSCQVEDLTSFSKGKGTIALDLSATASFNTETKAVNEGDYKNLDNYTVQFLKVGESDPVKTFKYAEIPASVELDNGAYTVKAFYGTNTDAASRTGFYVEGSNSFNLNGETDKSISLTCTPTYGKVKVEFTEMDTYFSDYYVTYSTSALGSSSTAKWSKADTEPWYLKLNNGGETVTATIYLTPKSQYQSKAATVVRTYDLAPNKAWTLQVAPSYNDKTGQLGVSIKIDEGTNDIPVDIVIPSEWV